jgi:hypothetical protein
MTMLLCGLVMILGGHAVAQSPARLQTLLNDTVAQLQIAYRHNIPEQERRYDALAQVVAAWRAAPRNEINNRLLEDWLRGAIRSSMPGSQAPLPPTPQFDRPSVRVENEPVVQPPATPVEPTVRPSVRDQDSPPPAADVESSDAVLEKSFGDPFGDDPEESGMND